MQSQKMAQRIDGDVDFGALAPFISIVASAGSAFGRGLHRAPIEDHGTGLRFFAREQTQQDPQIVRHRLETSGLDPALRLLVNGVPRRQIVRDHSPRTAGADHVAHGVEKRPRGMLSLGRISGPHRYGPRFPDTYLATDSAVGIRFRILDSEPSPSFS
jgi:hypothetical protein